jgi:hypothetical protein
MERKILISNEQRYYPSQFLLFISRVASYKWFYESLHSFYKSSSDQEKILSQISKFLFPAVNLFNLSMIIADRNNFYERAENISEFIQPILKNGDEFSKIEASYGFTTLGLQSVLGLAVSMIELCGKNQIATFINSEFRGVINSILKHFEYNQIDEFSNITSKIENFESYANYAIWGIGALSVFFGQDSARVYAVYKTPISHPELELPVLEPAVTKPITNDSVIVENKEDNNDDAKIAEDICQDFQNAIEDNNLGLVLSLE